MFRGQNAELDPVLVTLFVIVCLGIAAAAIAFVLFVPRIRRCFPALLSRKQDAVAWWQHVNSRVHERIRPELERRIGADFAKIERVKPDGSPAPATEEEVRQVMGDLIALFVFYLDMPVEGMPVKLPRLSANNLRGWTEEFERRFIAPTFRRVIVIRPGQLIVRQGALPGAEQSLGYIIPVEVFRKLGLAAVMRQVCRMADEEAVLPVPGIRATKLVKKGVGENAHYLFEMWLKS